MKRLFLSFIFVFIELFSLLAQKDLLHAGPMLGYLTMHEVMFWVQTKKSAQVQIAYYPKDNPTVVHWTEKVTTSKQTAFTAHLLGDSLIPNTLYTYDLYINGQKITLPYPTQFKTKAIWRYRTDPPDFSFATGSGTYINDPMWDRPGKTYGGGYEIYTAIYEKHPDFMIWLGDNVYLRQNEWNSWTGIVYRYTHDRALPQLQPLLASVHHYAIWDDHDYGPNNSDKSFAFKDLTLKAFKLFWTNPSYGLPDLPGAFTYFNWNDADFFLLDNRYYRDPDKVKTQNYKTQLGQKQLQWLKNALVFSKANFKFVVIGGQFLNTAGVYETYTNYGFDKERQEIINWIYNQNIYNVIFITGDRHHTELSVLKEQGKPTIWDITVSPFNSRPNIHAPNENNTLRVKGTVVTERNFAIIKLTGSNNDRKVIITVYNTKGDKLWSYEIPKEYPKKSQNH